jgi:FKBP-type peptidyl-prolyl cis-trans isomerase
LIIPANLAYGSTARPGIPANSTLVFDVTLLATT